MKKVLFVCLGNICRSPMAHGIFQCMVDDAGLSDQIVVDSAGTTSYHIGELPDKRARQTCQERGVKLTHRARAFSKDDFEAFDYILAMDKQNLLNIQKLEPAQHNASVKLMRAYDAKKPNADVPDPYFGGMDGFVEVYDMLERSCAELLVDVLKS
ncbi:MAG: low molecular weight protein-tyrosine-phosphatase [Bacteroidota bacterium]